MFIGRTAWGDENQDLSRLDGVEAVHGEPGRKLVMVDYLIDRTDPASIADVLAQRGFASMPQP